MLLDEVEDLISSNGQEQEIKEKVQDALIEVTRESLAAEREHHIQAIQSILHQAEDRLNTQIEERFEILDYYNYVLCIGRFCRILAFRC